MTDPSGTDRGTNAPPATSESIPHPLPVPVVLGLWMGLQCGVIGCTDSVRLWTHHPDPPQSLALVELIGVQLIAVALFCRAIDQWSTAFLASLAGIFFGQVAALQASASAAGAFRAETMIVAWIMGARLTQWNRSGVVARFAPALLAVWVFVPPLLRFENFDPLVPGSTNSFFRDGLIFRAAGQIDTARPVDFLYPLIPGLASISLEFIVNYILPNLRSFTRIRHTNLPS